jgi:hypothetical protein
MAGKPFDADQYEADDNAKYRIIEWLETNRFAAWVNPDLYGIDVLATRDGDDYGFEVEVKHNWQGEKFPYRTVHFSARKQKFIGWNHFFTMLNDERSCVLVVDEQALRAAPVVEKNTKFTTGELFIAVPISACVIFRLD